MSWTLQEEENGAEEEEEETAEDGEDDDEGDEEGRDGQGRLGCKVKIQKEAVEDWKLGWGAGGTCAQSHPTFPSDSFLVPQMRKKRRRRMKAPCGRELLKRRLELGWRLRGGQEHSRELGGLWIWTQVLVSAMDRQGLEQGQQEQGEVFFVQLL